MKIPLHVQLRRNSRIILNKILSFLVNNKPSKENLNINTIQTIAVVRPNYRIGNLIFLTPLINEIYEQNPNVKIDLIVGMKGADKIFEPMPNIDKVIDIPRKLLKSPLELYRFIKVVRSKKYDLVLNIASGSVSSQITASLVNGTYKASFLDEKNWTPLTHVISSKKRFQHSAHVPMQLLELFGIDQFKKAMVLDLKLADSEIQEGKNALETLLNQNGIKREDKKIIALFRNARWDKKIPDSWWEELITKMLQIDPTVQIIDILSPDIPAKLNDHCLEYSNKNLRLLGAFFNNCDLYISADTGPLHLAGASGVKARALFNKTNPASYGLLGEGNINIDINGKTTAEIAQIILEE